MGALRHAVLTALLLEVLLVALLAVCSAGANSDQTPLSGEDPVVLHPGARPAKVVVVLARQRSGSTHLCNQLGQHPCIVNLNEPWNSPNDVVRKKTGMGAGTIRNEPLEFLMAAHSASCPAAAEQPRCGGNCTVVIKLFDAHHIRREGLQKLLLHPDVATVALERNVEDEFCSKVHAEKLHDWGVTPQQHKKTATPCPVILEEEKIQFERFKRSHLAWFAFARGVLQQSRAYLEVPFHATAPCRNASHATYMTILRHAGWGSVDDVLLADDSLVDC